ncbi:MAG: hypothetical protein AAFN05_09185, partial [Pseudomonadota bacterium]
MKKITCVRSQRKSRNILASIDGSKRREQRVYILGPCGEACHQPRMHAALGRRVRVVARTGGLKGGVLYYDGQFDDARLALSLMRTLFELGGTAVNYVRATGL